MKPLLTRHYAYLLSFLGVQLQNLDFMKSIFRRQKAILGFLTLYDNLNPDKIVCGIKVLDFLSTFWR